jgi:hypothetical protein
MIPELGAILAQKLALEFNQSKTLLHPINHGIDHLGYFIKPDYVGRRRLRRVRRSGARQSFGVPILKWCLDESEKVWSTSLHLDPQLSSPAAHIPHTVMAQPS